MYREENKNMGDKTLNLHLITNNTITKIYVNALNCIDKRSYTLEEHLEVKGFYD